MNKKIADLLKSKVLANSAWLIILQVFNTIVPLLDNVWLGEQTAEEALGSLDVSSELQGTWN